MRHKDRAVERKQCAPEEISVVRTLIRSVRVRQPGVPYAQWPIVETYATEAQEKTFTHLRLEWPSFEVLPHGFLNDELADMALVILDKNRAAFVMPDGMIKDRKAPYPACFGNPTTAHCIAVGSCRRAPACND